MARLYWPQLRPFPTPSGALGLRQITNKSATILTALDSVRSAVADRAATWDAAEASALGAAAKALDLVELTVARYRKLASNPRLKAQAGLVGGDTAAPFRRKDT
jgi:hypothetical protein